MEIYSRHARPTLLSFLVGLDETTCNTVNDDQLVCQISLFVAILYPASFCFVFSRRGVRVAAIMSQ